ncbi:hypothetical protein [Dysgonomonas sp. 520]|uniref:hypothetical protein n=1 Tax=Dysgonomonas sp. 520 TaxID=2302931 RepID=UPI0013D2AFDA|nr:hypothetical protein [Dysgonomonas sp. 520]NDW10862.1 hypothetical protein [Dysgonomonas sp. 520]
MEQGRKICPLCGNEIPESDNHDFCCDCREIEQNRELQFYVEESSPENSEESTTNDENEVISGENDELIPENGEILPEKQKKISKTMIFYFVLCGVVLVLGLGSTFWVRHYQNTQKETETACWNECAKVNTPLEYSKYLVRFPEGMYVKEAENRIKEFREKEHANWMEARHSGNMGILYNFLNQYPDSPYTSDAKDIMDSISWADTRKLSTADAYKTYLDNFNLGYISGLHLEEANEKYSYLSSITNIEGLEADSIKTIITNFFGAVSNLKAYDIAFLSTPEIVPFLGHSKANAGSIIQMMENEKRSKKFEEMQYIPLLNETIIKDTTNTYFLDTRLVIETKYNNKKIQDTSDTTMVSIELNEDKKIRGVFLKSKQ